MNQVKYILSACLILMMISAAIFLYKTFPESGIVAQNKMAVDFVSAQKEIHSQPKEFSEAETEGKILFVKNCGTCHAVEKTDNFLEGFENRGPWKDRKEMYKWIRDPKDYMLHDTTGYTKGLKEVFGVSMLPSPNLSDRDIDKIIDYLIKADDQ